MDPIEACQNCAVQIRDPHQRTCPHCLEPLSTRSFRSEEGLERFRKDRRAHGADVPDEEGARRGLLATLLGLAAVVMVVAGGTILFSGVTSGSVPRATQALGQAAVPLAMGLGMLEMARRYGRKSA